MNGAQSLLETAARAGVDVCFANPGTTEMPLVAALDRVPKIRAVLGLFEGVCTGAADGYGRMLDRAALTLLHLGPGFANGIANLHNARRARSPVVNLIGDHASWHLAADAPLSSDIISLATPVSGWVRTASSGKRLADDVAEAIDAATGPPGQVASLVLPADFQWEQGSGLVSVHAERSRNEVEGERIEKLARLLREGARAAILLGDRALRARGQRAAARLAGATGAALFAETFPSRWERGRGNPAVARLPYFPEQAQAALEGFDLVILAGALAPVAFFGYEGGPSRLVEDDKAIVLASPSEDAQQGLELLASALGAPLSPPPAEPPPLPDPPSGPLDSDSIGRVLARCLPENAIVMDEAATSGLPFGIYGAGAAPHTLLSLTGGAIGQGLPCATGAALACPERKVIAFQADGSGLYTSQALWTQAREGLDVVTLVCSNRAYRILQVELARAGVAEPGPQARGLTSLEQPAIDWVSLSRGYGVPAQRVENAEDLARALPRALAEPGPQLIEMVI